MAFLRIQLWARFHWPEKKIRRLLYNNVSEGEFKRNNNNLLYRKKNEIWKAASKLKIDSV